MCLPKRCRTNKVTGSVPVTGTIVASTHEGSYTRTNGGLHVPGGGGRVGCGASGVGTITRDSVG